ncbi:MAG: hypothetical protein K2W81_11510 [Sphingomonas sp.]|uniref:hypothetical protein n=1 Tax=Sphingomonas sp. TaxID=28214 RepID=UPI0025CB813D|nr:hypothetical protein [Sphingomonas sp.]MBY0284576.1 hypothetical protein [Sphingomonas sp.]
MISLALVLLFQATPSPQTMPPDDFRRQVSLSKLCFLEGEKRGDVGRLDLVAGENLPNIALKRPGSAPPIFQEGKITSVLIMDGGESSKSTVAISGKAGSEGATLEIHTTRTGAAPAVFSLFLRTSDGSSHRFSCVDNLRPPPSGTPK